MRARNGWLFPLMVLAAGSVVVFGCIGIAAITGYLPLTKVTVMPLSVPTITPSLEQKAPGATNGELHPAVAVATTPSGADGTLSEVAPAGKGYPVQKKSSPQ